MAGNRKPSRFRFFAPKPAIRRGCDARRYVARGEPHVLAWRLRCAIFATTLTRCAISARVNPSGKTMRNGFGWTSAAVVVGAGEPPPPASLTIANDDERQRATSAGERGEPSRAGSGCATLPGRRPRLRRHHAGAALDHSR